MSSKSKSKKHKISIKYEECRSSDQPLLASFPSTVSPFAMNKVKEISFSLSHTPEGQKLSASLEGNTTTKFSSNPSTDSARQEALGTKYLIGVFDKKEQTLRLVDTPALFQLLPNYSHISTEDVSSSDITKENFMAKKIQLAQQFGTTMAKKGLHDPTNIIKDTQISDKAVKETEVANKTAHLLKGNEMAENERGEVLPPYNEHAKKSRDVFPLDTFIPKEIEEELQEGAKVITEAMKDENTIQALRDSCSYPEIVLTLIEHAFPKKLFSTPPEKAAEHLTYLTYLMRFYSKLRDGFRFQKKNFINIAEVIGIPFPIFTRFISLFCSPSLLSHETFTTTEKLTLKLLNHIIIAALWANNFVVDFHLLALDLSYDLSKLLRHVRFLGLTQFELVGKDQYFSDQLYCLKCPVKFAPMFERFVGKRKR